jgi:hypothetical protein
MLHLKDGGHALAANVALGRFINDYFSWLWLA